MNLYHNLHIQKRPKNNRNPFLKWSDELFEIQVLDSFAVFGINNNIVAQTFIPRLEVPLYLILFDSVDELKTLASKIPFRFGKHSESCERKHCRGGDASRHISIKPDAVELTFWKLFQNLISNKEQLRCYIRSSWGDYFG